METAGLSESAIAGNYQQNMTRAEFTSVLVNVFDAVGGDADASGVAARFTDISGADEEKINKAYAARLITGLSSTSFAPDMPLTREQAAVLLINFANRIDLIYAEPDESPRFVDASDISGWARQSVSVCVKNRFMVGVSGDEFAPKALLTREQGLTLLYNIVNKGLLSPAREQASGGALRRGADFTLYGAKAYFIAVENGKSALYAIATGQAGSKPTKIADAYGLTERDGYIYTILSENGVHGDLAKIDAATGETSRLEKIRGKSSFAVEGKYVYCTNYMSPITRMKTDGSEKTEIARTENAENVFISGDWLYFTQNGVKRVRLADGSVETVCAIDGVTDFIVYGGKIYMLVAANDPERKTESLTDLYVTADQSSGAAVKIAERVGFIYSCARGVYAYGGEPHDTNAVYRADGERLVKLEGSSLDILTFNNASNLHFSDDGKLYYSVYKPNTSSEFFDYQYYMYTNVIDLKTDKTTAIDGGHMYIHCSDEAAYAAPNQQYRLSEKAEPKEAATVKKAESILALIIKPTMSDVEKAKAIHDYIILNCVYDIDSIDTAGEYSFTYLFYTNRFNPAYFNINRFDDAHTAYGALINGLAMCGGYTKAAWLLLSMCDIENYSLSGTAEQPGYDAASHTWNIVKLGNAYRHIDVTWDDPMPDRPGKTSEEYFNVDSDFILRSHTLDEESKALMAALG
jgi:hypothetical protein